MAGIMLGLRRLGHSRGGIHRPGELKFYRVFKNMAEKGGRIREARLGLALALSKRPAQLLEQALLFFTLWRRGKIR